MGYLGEHICAEKKGFLDYADPVEMSLGFEEDF